MAVSEEESSSANSKSRLASNGTYYLAKCVLRGSVVLQVVHGHIRSPSSSDIVFGKENSIELVMIDDDGVVQSICEQPVFGTIKDLAILPWNEMFHARSPEMLGRDLLLVLSDSGKLSFLTFCNEMHRFFPWTHIQLSGPGNSRYNIGRMLAVDSSGLYIAVSAYDNQIALFSASTSGGSDAIDKRIYYPPNFERDTTFEEDVDNISGTIWSMCFISKYSHQSHKEYKALLAVLLNRRGSYVNELILLEWNLREEIVQVISKFVEEGPLAHNVIEVPNSYGFAILFRVGDALLLDLRDPQNPKCVHKISLSILSPQTEEQNFVEESIRVNDVDEEGIFNVAASALLELSDLNKDDDLMNIDGENSGNIKPTLNHVCSWSWEPGTHNNPRMVFCVDSGEIFMMEISSDSDGPKVNLSDSLYKSLPSKSLLWVEDGFLALLVEMSDGMILKFDENKLIYTSAIQNIAPILDMSVGDHHEEKHDQMFACCGMAPEGSLRIIRSGISVEKLLKTAPIYPGITGTWTVKMNVTDIYHSYLVLSFVEETRVLSVGVSFTDVTDSVGFQPDVCTLACGLIGDGLLVQIHQFAVRVCLPTIAAHHNGIPMHHPVSTSWAPDNTSINLGAVGHEIIVVGTSNPITLYILGLKCSSPYNYEVYQRQQVNLQSELSCISIPKNSVIDSLKLEDKNADVIVLGTHKPTVEVISYNKCDNGIKVLAVGTISLTNTMGTTISGCVPQDVRLVLVDRLYILSGLRNGMLLRFEWPTNSYSPQTKDGFQICLQLIAIRRIGVTPAFLVPLSDLLDADVIALSDRPWLLQAARHSLSYTSISFQPSTHVTPVCSIECPKGILFVAENSLHLVEMVQSKRLNVQKFDMGGTPRKVLYHKESRLLLVMRTELSHDSYSSDICCVDPLSGSVLSSFKLDPGETGKCMDFVKVGNEHALVIGTSLSAGPAIMPSGEAESTKGRLIVLCLEHRQNSDTGSMSMCSNSLRASPFREIVGYGSEQLSSSSSSVDDNNSCDGIKLEETEVWNLRLSYSTIWPGMVLAVCPYLDRYFLASAGNAFYVCSFPNENTQRIRRLAVGRTRFMIMTLTAHITRIAVGDCRDGVLFFSYHEDAKKLEQVYCDPVQRLVAECILMDVETAVVSDRKGSLAVLSCSNRQGDNASPECNLELNSSYYMGEIAMSIRKGSFSYKLPADDSLRGCDVTSTILGTSQNSIVASTLLGSIIIFIPLTREEYELLEVVQARLVVHPLTAPILGNDHNEFRSRESPSGVRKILDGDMLAQFLELTSMQQDAILALPMGSPNTVMMNFKPSPSVINVNQVVRLLERVHYALN